MCAQQTLRRVTWRRRWQPMKVCMDLATQRHWKWRMNLLGLWSVLTGFRSVCSTSLYTLNLPSVFFVWNCPNFLELFQLRSITHIGIARNLSWGNHSWGQKGRNSRQKTSSGGGDSKGGAVSPLPTSQWVWECCKLPLRDSMWSPDRKCILDGLRAQKACLVALNVVWFPYIESIRVLVLCQS